MMRQIFLLFVISTLFLATTGKGTLSTITGTWSGSWVPKGGSLDSITVEFRLDAAGKLTGRFRTPVPMDFSKVSFNPATEVVVCEATDGKTGKLYKLEGKFKGTELIGTLSLNDTAGEVRLIKWTYVPH